jgi:hypothetical protein
MLQELKFAESHSQPFELVLVTRNSSGDPTGKKNCIADSGYKLSQFYLRNRGKPKPRKQEAAKPQDKNVKVVKSHKNITAYVDTSEREVNESQA